ncbi:MAG: Flp pilus assembly complex ATPase component TadA [Phycisphaerales bacterium]|nr:Flp pilus assembly complex ATPase component TadA [Phycisphaerae bacterium]NNF43823.1 Flp pilus assembly complex ATPase component TadA [Phycisphaerales bacterium]NNM27191.1 Flp pilus assembly complex ATPase component TadA [Phycisphaerales bacterium]
MGKFDLDDLLEDLGRTPSGQPLEPPTPDEPAAEDDAFVRNDPNETPRPPDISGEGLGNANTQIAPHNADPTRVKPDDALTAIYKPDAQDVPEGTDDFGRCLLERAIITTEQLATAQRVMKQSPGSRLPAILMDSGIDEVAVQQVVADFARLPFERIEEYDDQTLEKLGTEFCKAHLVMPLRTEGSRLVVGTVNADDVFRLDDVKRRLRIPSIKHVLVTAADIKAILEEIGEEQTPDVDVNEILADVSEHDVELVKDTAEEATMDEAESSPVVRYVNHIIQTALKEGASDIHVEPEEKSMKVRFRIDGVLFEMMNPPRAMHASLTSRLKIMANLDIAERRLPQDGRIRASVMGRQIDLRVSTIPTPKGEKTVLRILDNRSIRVPLDELGFSEDTLMIWKNQVRQPHGIILVTGPTGSGKTTTLYASLQQLDLRRLNVSTVEDPVEYNLEGITQLQTHDKIGMTFGVALRSLMRQDPDVIMLGEIRDMETATIAIQAAMTGHLVLSTLHTNDAPSSITRLINIGIEPFLVAGAVRSVLAQRLVRRMCEHCAEEVPVTDEISDFLIMHGITAETVRHPAGCAKCRETGYHGRAGLYEMLVLDDHLGDQVARNPSVTEFRRQCTERGMTTLRQDGFMKVAKGITTVEEVLRVTESTI